CSLLAPRATAHSAGERPAPFAPGLDGGSRVMAGSGTESERRAGWPRRLLPVALLVAILAAFFAFGLDRYVSFETLKANRAALQDFVARNLVLASLVYLLGYAVLTAASLPVATLVTLMGGFLFG